MYRLSLFIPAAMLLASGSGLACGGGDGVGPGTPVLTSVEVTPATASLFTVAPGNTVALSVAALDQNGDAVAGNPSFSSSNTAVASAGSDGTITAAGAGTAVITASVTANGVTEAGISTVTVHVAPTSAQVFAPQFAFQPATVDVGAGGSVTWTFGPIHHDVTFTTQGSPANIPELENGSALRTFPSNGEFDYLCSIHPTMRGSVRVH